MAMLTATDQPLLHVKQKPINVNAQVTVPSDMISVNVIPNGPGFQDLIRTEIRANNNQFSSNLILSTLSGQSSVN